MTTIKKRLVFAFICLLILSNNAFCQISIYQFRKLNLSLEVPAGVISKKSAVIVSVPDEIEANSRKAGEWISIAKKAHIGFRKMGIDALFYLNEKDLYSSNGSLGLYVESFNKRDIHYIIFITKYDNGVELRVLPYSKNNLLIKNNETGFYTKSAFLNKALITLGREIKRSDLDIGNFLIPEFPTFLSANSIIEDQRITRYPGQIRRAKLAIEKFRKIDFPKDLDPKQKETLIQYNASIDSMNSKLAKLLKDYPYSFELIDRMSTTEMIRNRYQFVLRNLNGTTESIRKMLGFSIENSKAVYESTIPIMPDDLSFKNYDRDEIVYKFYIRQNISKAIYTGYWDAEAQWEKALMNYLNLAWQSIESSK